MELNIRFWRQNSMKNFATLILLFLTFSMNYSIAECFSSSNHLTNGTAGEIENLKPEQLKTSQKK